MFWHELVPLILCVGFAAGVIGNLVASLLWALPALIHLHRKLNRHHNEHMAILKAINSGAGVTRNQPDR
jgi:hypothetical protein